MTCFTYRSSATTGAQLVFRLNWNCSAELTPRYFALTRPVSSVQANPVLQTSPENGQALSDTSVYDIL